MAREKTVPPDVLTLHQMAEGCRAAPALAINVCVGAGRYIADGHMPFVIDTYVKDNGFIHPRHTDSEYPTLAEALNHPGALPYGSSTLCASCRELDIEELYPFTKA